MTLFFPPFFLLLSRGNSAEEEKVIFLFHLPHLRGGILSVKDFFSFYTRGTFSRAFCNKRKKAQRDVSDGRLYDSTRFPWPLPGNFNKFSRFLCGWWLGYEFGSFRDNDGRQRQVNCPFPSSAVHRVAWEIERIAAGGFAPEHVSIINSKEASLYKQ